MPDLSLPDIRLPDIKLPDGLRDMSRSDIQHAIGDRLPKKGDMPDIDLPKAVEQRLTKIEKAIANVDLPKAVEDRLPGRKKPNRILPVAAVVAVGSMFAAAWWLITSPTAITKVREAADRVRLRVTGKSTDMVRFDDDEDLGSLLPETGQARPSVAEETWPDTFAEVEPVKAGNGSSTEHPAGV